MNNTMSDNISICREFTVKTATCLNGDKRHGHNGDKLKRTEVGEDVRVGVGPMELYGVRFWLERDRRRRSSADNDDSEECIYVRIDSSAR